MWRRNLPKHTHAENVPLSALLNSAVRQVIEEKRDQGPIILMIFLFLSRLFNGRFSTKTTAGANIDLVVFYSSSTSFQGCKLVQSKCQNFCYILTARSKK